MNSRALWMPSLPDLILGSHSPPPYLQPQLQGPCQYPGLVSCGCPQTWWVKTAHIYSLTVLEIGSPKSECQLDCFLLDALKKKPILSPFPASKAAFFAFLGLWPLPSSSSQQQNILLWYHLCQISLCFPAIRTLVIAFRALLGNSG